VYDRSFLLSADSLFRQESAADGFSSASGTLDLLGARASANLFSASQSTGGIHTPETLIAPSAQLGSIGQHIEAGTPGNFGMSDEVAFIAGVYSDGTLPLYAFSAWNSDTPATYTGGFTNTAKWGASTAGTTGGTVDYYFNPASNWNATEQTFLAAGLALWSDVANIHFVQTTNAASAQIEFTRGTDGGAETTPSETGPSGAGTTGGSVLLTLTQATVSIDTSVAGFGPINGSFTAEGGYPIMTFLHEEGHSIGLGHAGAYNGDVNSSTQQFSPYDTRLWSIMSYIEPQDSRAEYFSSYPVTGTSWHGSDPTGLMPLDILAAQALYGAPTTTPLSGGQTFGFDCNVAGATEMFFDFTKNTTPILTLYDTGTGNTLDLSGYTTASTVNLNAGTFSSFDGMVNNVAIAFGTKIDALDGTTGNDTVTGNNDGDTFTGDGGSDHFTGGTGVDMAVFAGARAGYTVQAQGGGVFTVENNTTLATTTLTNVEFAKFADQTVPLSATPPALAGDGQTGTYIEQQTPVAVDGTITVTAGSSPTITGALVQISTGFVTGDTLSLPANANGITASWDPTTHDLTLGGSATAAQYQDALRSVVFSSTSDNPGSVQRGFAMYVTDSGGQQSNVALDVVHVVPVNDPPSGTDATLSIADAAYTFKTADFGFHDVDANVFETVLITTLPAAGTLKDDGVAVHAGQIVSTDDINSGELVYTPNGSGTNYAHFTFQVGDDGGTANGGSDTDATPNTLTFNVAPPVTSPTLGGGTQPEQTYIEGGAPFTLFPGSTVALPAGETIHWIVINGAGTNQLVLPTTPGFSMSFSNGTYFLGSGTGDAAAFAAALSSIQFVSNTDNPTGDGSAASGPPSTTLTITAQLATTDNVLSNVISNQVLVEAVNDPPSGADKTLNIIENTHTIVANDFGFTDVDLNNFAGVVITTIPNAGSLTLNATAVTAGQFVAIADINAQKLVFTPAGTGTNYAHFTFQVEDDGGTQLGGSNLDPTPNTMTFNVSIQPPQLTNVSNSASGYTENAAPIGLGTITITASIPQTIAGATVALTGFQPGDTLTFTPQSGITGSYNATTGVLTFSGTASAATYQTLLHSVSYSSTSDNPTDYGTDQSRFAQFTVTDGANSSNTVQQFITITAVNDPPVLSGAGNTASYTEHAAGVAVTPGIVVADPDNMTVASATVTISSGFAAGDVLSYVNPNPDSSAVSASWNATTHTLTLSGSDTLADYQAVLRAVTFSSTSSDPTLGGTDTSRTISVTVSDGALSSAAVTSTVAVTGLDVAPVLAGGGNTAAYTEQGTAAAVVPNLTVSDADNTTLASATVTISNGFAAGDLLKFTNQNGITGSYNATTHALTLSGSASLANYQAALRSVTFASTSDDPTLGGSDASRSISVTVNDGTLSSAAATSSVAVTAVDDAPVIGGANTTVNYTEQGTPVAVLPGITLADPDNTTLTGAVVGIPGGAAAGDILNFVNQNGITGVWVASSNALVLSGTASLAAYQAAIRSVTYSSTSHDPTLGGTDTTRTIGVTVNDGTLQAGALGTVAITAVDDAPALTGGGNTAAYTEQGAAAAVVPGIVVSDVDNTTLASATVTISNGFAAGDVLNFANQNGITGSWNAATHVLTLSGSASLANYQAALRGVTFSSTSDDPTLGGTDAGRTISVAVSDGTLSSTAATSTVAVTAVNDAPVLGSGGNTVGYTEQGTAVAVNAGLTVADPDNATLAGATVVIASGFAAGDILNFANQNGISGSWNAATHVLTLSGAASVANYQAALRSVTFSSPSDDPTAGGTDASRTIAFQVDDGQSANHASNIASTTLNVTAVNDAPVLGGGGNTVGYTEQGAAVAVDTGVTVADADNTTLAGATVTIASGFVAGDVLNFLNQNGITGNWNAATHALTLSGSASLANYQAALRSVTFSSPSDNPDNFGANPSRTIAFQADDGQSANHASNAISTTLNVTAVNDAPVLGGAGNSVGYTEQGTPAVLDGAITIADDTATLAGASIAIASGFVAGDVLNFLNQNGITGSWNAATHILTLSGTASLANYQAALRSITFSSPSDNPDNYGTSPNRTITWQVDDGQSSNHASNTVSTALHVTAVDDTPVAHNDDFATTEYTAIGGLNVFADNGHGADSDPDNLSLVVQAVNGSAANVGHQIALASGALVTVNADGSFFYDPNGAFNLAAPESGASNTTATDTFNYTINGTVETATVTVTGVDGNDTLHGTAGNDHLDGGIGDDIVVFTGDQADYTISFDTTTLTYTVQDNRPGAPDGTDTVKDVDHFQFADGTFDYSTYVVSGTNALGGTITTAYDEGNNHPWASFTTSTDAQGSLLLENITTDAGVVWTNSFDTTNSSDVLWSTTSLIQNLPQTEVDTYDDGTHTVTLFNYTGSEPWAQAELFFDANWNVVAIGGQNRDGSQITAAQVMPALDTAQWYATPFDPNEGLPLPLTLTGGSNMDQLYGGAGNDTLNGMGGNDIIGGGKGNDTLTGGTGADHFVFHDGDGLDTITDFDATSDVVELHGYGIGSFAQLQSLMTQSGADTVITFDPNNVITLHNVTIAQLHSGDFVLS
jgi:hypothetical protein